MGKIYFASLIGGVLLLASCTSDKVVPVDPNCPEEISYGQQVAPMIQTNCSTSGCHDVAGPGKPALTNHTEVSANASSILSVIRHEGPGTPMPLGQPKMADSLIQQFSCWIDQGLQDN